MNSRGRPAPRPLRRGRAFTLIELLVVIAVVLVLAALILPVVFSSMRSARTANCQSNLRQIATGFMLYTKRHGGFMPPTGSPGGSPPRRFPYWHKNLTPLVQDPGIFHCPSKPRAAVGYGLNHIWCGPDEIYGEGTAMNNVSKEFSQVRTPSRTLIICDAGHITNRDDPTTKWIEEDKSNAGGSCFFPYDNRPGKPGKYTWWYRGKTAPSPRHYGHKTNAMFFDNHVEGIRTADIVDDLWDEPGCIYDNDGHPKRR